MYKVAGLILLALVGLSSLPYLLYWLLWSFTGRGIASQVGATRRYAKRLATWRDLGFEDGWHDSHRRGARQGDRVPLGAMTTSF
jgi:hypothetical protein